MQIAKSDKIPIYITERSAKGIWEFKRGMTMHSGGHDDVNKVILKHTMILFEFSNNKRGCFSLI